jgi:hypothetical protein
MSLGMGLALYGLFMAGVIVSMSWIIHRFPSVFGYDVEGGVNNG